MLVWLITGSSSGLGHSLASAVLKAGHKAVVTARSADKVRSFEEEFPGRALAVALDLNDKASIIFAVAQATAMFGDIDVLVNNAGYGYRAAIEEGDEQDVADLFTAHVFGPVALIKAVLPSMRSRRQGTIVNVSSIGAQFYGPGSGYYSAAKMAQEGITLTLKAEIEPLGIRVMVVEPGAFRTDFTGRSLKGATVAIDDYADTVGPRRKENDQSDGTQPGDPERAAEVILEMIGQPSLPRRLLLGPDAVSVVRKSLFAQLDEIDGNEIVSKSTDFARES